MATTIFVPLFFVRGMTRIFFAQLGVVLIVTLGCSLVVALIGGIVYGAYLKRSRPAVYEGLATDLERFSTR